MKVDKLVPPVFIILAWLYSAQGFKALDVTLVVESSNNVPPGLWHLITSTIKDSVILLGDIGICDIQVAAITFAKDVTLNWDFGSDQTSSTESFMSAMDNLPQLPGDSSSFVPALTMASKVVSGKANRADVPDLTIFYTWSKSEENGLKEAAEKLKAVSNVLVVYITSNVDLEQLKMIASTPKTEQPEDRTVFHNSEDKTSRIMPLIVDKQECLKCESFELPQSVTKDQQFYTVQGSSGDRQMNLNKLLTELGVKMDKQESLVIQGKGPFSLKCICADVKHTTNLVLKGYTNMDQRMLFSELTVPVMDQSDWKNICIRAEASESKSQVDRVELKFKGKKSAKVRSLVLQSCIQMP